MHFGKQRSSFLLLVLPLIRSTYGFMENFNARREKLLKPEIRPDLYDVVDRQWKDNTQLNIQMHVGDDETGFLTVKDMVIQLGAPYTKDDDEDHVKLPGSDGVNARCSSGGHRLNVLSNGQFVNMDGTQYIDCQKGAWEMCWMKDRPAGTIVFAFHLPETYSRNKAILPEGDVWLSFPVWTTDGLRYGQMAKKKVMEEIEYYTHKWNEELEKYQMTKNPIMKAIHERNADVYAGKCDDAWDYSLATIPDNDQCYELQENLLLSRQGLLWTKSGHKDVLFGHAIASLSCKGNNLSSFSSGALRP